ncbi:rCG41531 [Rattus norvegicus]|uniref:RCG41531 n=1 Tax=Rattus norvegicus TaxID=10116 RepID=A6II49_RAT|nr:rCG41531 [Rattus norvegicus]
MDFSLLEQMCTRFPTVRGMLDLILRLVPSWL